MTTQAPTSDVVEGQRCINGEGTPIAGLRVGEKEVKTVLPITAYKPPGSPQEFEAGEGNSLIPSIAFEPGWCRALTGVRVKIDGL